MKKRILIFTLIGWGWMSAQAWMPVLSPEGTAQASARNTQPQGIAQPHVLSPNERLPSQNESPAMASARAAQGLNIPQSPERYTDTIRFELVNGVMVVPAHINGNPAKFIFDTGGRNIISVDSAQKYGVTIHGAQTVSDANNLAATFQSGVMPGLKICPSAQEQAAPVMVMPPQSVFPGIGRGRHIGPRSL